MLFTVCGLLLVTTVHASDILWSSAGGSAWLTAANWTGSVLPTASDNAQFGVNPTAATGVGINGNGTLVPGSQVEDVGAIEVTSARNNVNMLVGNSTTTAAKDMTLALKGAVVNGVANTILRNNGSGTTTLTLQDTQGSGNKTMGVRIGNSAAVIDAVSPIVISSILSSSTAGYGLTKSGAGTLTLSAANTLSGDITVNAGTLRLTTGGTIVSVPNIILASGTTLDVSTLTTALTLASSQGLKSSASASTATITTASDKGLTTGASSLIQFTAYNGSTTPLTLSGAGALTLQSGNPVTVTVTGSALGAGDYKLIGKGAGGTVSGTPNSVTVNGSGLAGGTSASLQIIGDELFLHVVSSGTPKITVQLPGEASANAGSTTAQTAGTAFDITLTATTDGTTMDTSYSGVTNITFSGPTGSPTYLATVSFSSGVGTVNITLTKAETTAITATDGTMTGTTSSSLLINPGAIASYTVAASSPQTVGIAFNVVVTAKDANDNIVTTDSSTSVTMGSGSGNVSFATNPKTLSSGTFTVSATDNTAETTTITANDGSKNGTSGNIVVNIIPKYRTRQSGNWSDFNTWQVDTTGGGFVDATTGQTPTTADDTIEILNTHTVTVAAPVSVDQVTVDAGGQITISGVVLTLVNGSGTDLIINGTVLNSGTFTVSSGATWALNAGGTFIYNTTTGFSTPLNSAAIDPASTIIYRGSSTLSPVPSISARTNGNVLFESTSGAYAPVSTSGGNPWTINGNLLIGATGVGTVSYNTTGFTGAITNVGSLVLGSGSTLTVGTSGYTLKGNLTNDGTLTLSSGSFTFDGTATIAGASAVSFANGFTIAAARTVKLAQSINIPSGKIGTVNGTLAGTGTITGSGSVTVSATGTLSPGSSIGTLTFATPPTLSGATVMEIDRNSGSPLSDKIVLSSGQLDYGGTLTVVNIGSTLQLNDTFTLFAADTLFGSFTTVTLPTLPTGLSWDTSQLTVDGTIKVTCDGTLSASAGPTQVICFGSSTAIGGSPTASGGSGAGYTYSWSPVTDLSSATAANPTASPTVTTTYTVTVTDANGCTAQSPVLVTVNQLPTVSVNSETICTGGSTTLTANTSAGNPSYLWSPGGATTASITVSPAATTIYTVTVTDGTTTCANSASGTVTVNSLPTVTIAPATTNVECGGAVTFTADPAGDGPLTYQWYDNLTNAIADETNVTLTVNDVHPAATGNYTIVVTFPFCSVSAVASLTVVDTTAPVITLNGANPATNECHMAYTDAGATAGDACSGSVSVATNSDVNADVPGVYTVTYTSDDGNGNTNTVTRTVYVVDAIAPVLTVLGANPATNECHMAYTDAGATASDACAGSVSVATNNLVNANIPGAYTVTYTSDDGNGNTNNATRTVYVVDTLAPVLTVLGANPATNECHMAYTDAGATASDACAGSVGISTNSAVDANAPGVYIVAYTSDDGNGNTNTATRTVYVVDTTAPLITYYFTNLTLSEDGSCQALMPDVTGASYILAEDNCSSTVTITQTPTNNAILTLGTNEVVLTVADSSGNTVHSTNTIVVVDVTPPVVALNGANPLTVECHGSFADPGASASDNCSGVVAVSTNGIVDVNVPGSYTIDYSTTDAAGNSATNTRIVNVVDTIGPVITLNGANPLTVQCHDSFSDPDATASDACAGSVGVTTSGGVDVNTPGSYLLTYTADDGNGNTNSITRTVNVVDTIGPVIAILGLNPATNECHVAYEDSGATVSDACAGNVNVSTNNPVDANAPGTYTVTYTSDDGNGNTNTATRTVYVVDTVGPVLACGTSKVVECGSLWTFDEPEVLDGCSGTNVTVTVLDTSTNGDTFTRTWAASDESGNTNTCSQSVTLVDTSPPQLVCETNKLVECGSLWSFDEPSAVDGCSGTNVTLTVLDTLTNGPTFTRTWLASDPAGNANSCSQSVTLMDTTPPAITFSPTNRSLIESDNCVVVLPDFTGELTASDSCSEVILSQSPMAGTEVGQGQYVVTFTASDASSNITTCTLLLTVTSPPGANTNISISEFVAKNIIGITDDFSSHSDWIEIHNAGPCPVNLNGWSLTDNAALLTKWRFPATNIAAGQFLVVWASDRNRRIPGAPLHTNFKMADEGEYLALVQPDGVTIATQFTPTFPPQLPDVSYGMPSDGVTNSYLAWPTPGLPNSPGTNFVIANLEFNPDRGWFTNFVSVTIGSPTPGVTIYFTTNGTVPGPTNGFVYSSALVFSNTTVLRGAAYRPAYVPNVATHTYVFPTQVADQTGADFPTNWGFTELGTVPAYYRCNSNLVNDPRWGNQIPAALLSLPTLSVVMNPDEMFGTNGIYSNPFGDGDVWERPCSVEYFRPDSKPGFQINCGIRIHGQISRDPAYTPKHSLRLLFKQMYGSGKLFFNLYPGSPVQDFDVLVLHASLSDHWHGVGALAQMQRDQWSADTQQETGGYGTHGTYVNLYINGLYWGMYNAGERPDANYAAHYLGGNKSDYDALHGNDLMDGTTNAWNELITLAEAGITNDIAWSNVCYYLNVPHFIDYLLINFYAINTEWLDHNWWIEGSVTHGVPFHFFSWDAEDGIGGSRSTAPITYDVIGLAETVPTWPGVLYSSLHQYPEFRRLFGDHAQQLLFNRGALTPERSSARWMKRAQEIDSAITAETARWGITNWWATSVWGADWKLYTHDDWLAEQTYLMTDWFPQRADILIAQLRNVGLYPSLDAPVFTPHGGIIVESLPVTITTPTGTILYCTTNGTDPRLPDGSASPDALVFDQGTTFTLTLTNSSRLLARAFATNTWSAMVEAEYPRSDGVELRIENITRRSDGTVKLDLLAWPGASYTLRAATNFNDWEAVATVLPFPNGTFNFVDTAATNHPVRFYRLTWP